MAGTLTAALKADDLFDLVYALKRPYRKNAAFIMNDRTIALVRKFKDSNGAYIWQPSYQAGEPDKILGYNVYTSEYAPEDAIAFGDYSSRSSSGCMMPLNTSSSHSCIWLPYWANTFSSCLILGSASR